MIELYVRHDDCVGTWDAPQNKWRMRSVGWLNTDEDGLMMMCIGLLHCCGCTVAVTEDAMRLAKCCMQDFDDNANCFERWFEAPLLTAAITEMRLAK